MDHQDAAARIRALAGDRPPRVGLILGSGLGELAEAIESSSDIGYSDLPGFPAPTVAGHEGRLRLGAWSGRRLRVFRVDFIFTKDMTFNNWPCRSVHFGRPVAKR